ncbi:MAG: DNA polymerase III subunit delta, partial [Bacteroidota bacterium]
WFIDSLMKELDQHVLSPAEEAFNKTLLYGGEFQLAQLIQTCRSFPVMANRRLVLVKEAQKMPKADWTKLEAYWKNPVPSTVLALACKTKSLPIGKAAIKDIQQHGVFLHAKKMYDRDVLAWLTEYLKDTGMQFAPKVPGILLTNLGTNIPLIVNELNKILVYLKATKQDQIQEDFVYEMINVDKEFNVFELIGAISQKNKSRSHMIIDRLTQNVKLNPPILIISALYRFFYNVSLVWDYQLRDPNAVKNQLGVNYFAAKDYLLAKTKFPRAKVMKNLLHIKEADASLKGFYPSNMKEDHILKTLVFRLLD